MTKQPLSGAMVISFALCNAFLLSAQEDPRPEVNTPVDRRPLQERRNSSPDPQPDDRALKSAVGDRFKLGVGVSHFVVRQPEDAALIRQHFQILTPENCMKPQSIQPAEDSWRFEAADHFVNFARSNRLEVVGHCLIWAKDDRTDEWMKLENGEPVSRETLLRRIETHIQTVVERYADAATAWDVVNEAIADGGEELLRDSVYSRATGMGFIVAAFKAARVSDPDALLIDVVTRGRWWAEDGKYRDELATHDPYKNGLPEEIERKQIEQYVALFSLFADYSDLIDRVSFWNLHDGQSWLNYFPWRRVNHPLLFDRERRPKPVFDAVYALLQNMKSGHAR